MPESNFVSEADFERLLNSIPMGSANSKLGRQDWEMCFRTMYSCALRIKETCGLMPENFDLEHKILSLPETKTGWKHCKCSKWKAPEGSKRNTILVTVNKDCKKCSGEAWIRVTQRTTILPTDIEDLKSYLDTKERGKLIWPITRQTVWFKFKAMCLASGLRYFWQKEDRAFKKGWPYLLRSSREKIMEDLGCKPSIMDLKMRHKARSMGDVYRARTIYDLLAWEAEHYTPMQHAKQSMIENKELLERLAE